MQLDNLDACEDWLELSDGSKLFLKPEGDAEFEALSVPVLAHHLATINRWGGKARAPFSVAQHTLGVTDTVAAFGGGPRLQVLAMLHDAHEPFMGGDMPTPMKRWSQRIAGASAELFLADRIDDAVRSAFGIAPPSLEEMRAIKQADTLALAAEHRDLCHQPARDNWTARLPSPAAIATIEPWPWQMARERFAERLTHLLAAYHAQYGAL